MWRKLLWYGGLASIVLGLGCATAYVALRLGGMVHPQVVKRVLPEQVHSVAHSAGVLGRMESVYYHDGGLCYEKHFMPNEEGFPYGQVNVNYGRWVSRSPDGKREYAIQWPDPAGKWVEWYPSGQKRCEKEWVQGKRHGRWRSWGEDGTPRSEASYLRGKKHGIEVIYADNGSKVVESHYRHGFPDGLQREWYETGARRYEALMRAPRETEQVQAQVQTFQDLLKKPTQAVSRTVYRMSFSADGEAAARLEGEDPMGPWISWYSNGQVKRAGYYVCGERHGKWTHWFATGERYMATWYNHGEEVDTPSRALRAWYADVAENRLKTYVKEQ